MGALQRVKKFFVPAKPAKQTDEERGVFVAWTGQENFWTSFLPKPSTSGIDISPEIAYQISVVYACVNKIASTIAMLPVDLIDESDNRFHEVRNNPATRLLNVTPDNEYPAYYIRQSLVAMTLLFGRGYAWIERVNGRPTRINYASTLDVLERRVDNVLMYRITDRRGVDIKERWLPVGDVMCLRYLFSQSPVVVNKDAVGLLKSAQDYAAQFFQNGGVMSGLLTSEQPISSEQIKELQASWDQQRDRHTRMIPFGFKYHRFGVEPDKAQNTEARKFNAQEVCRIFNMPPAMIGLEGGSSYGDYENQAKHFATHTIAPVCAAIEGEYNMKLLFISEQGRLFFRHNLDELMRGDMKSRAEYYDKMLQAGVYSRDEVRRRERYNPIDGGHIHTVQINQIALDKLEAYSEKISAPEQSEALNTNNNDSNSDSDSED